ncbi:MAG: polymerase sigma [Ignavibacteria bacterium]|nr:polymerase sigma [Ignavibacteria bacterium]
MENRIQNDYSAYLLGRIKKAILNVEPSAEVYLFGSRARDDFKEDSDWDLLILLSAVINMDIKKRIVHNLLEIEISENQTFNRIYYNYDEWHSSKLIQATPFYQSVSKDAIKL